MEIQIITGLSCNFSCSHCLNSSGPGNTQLDLTKKEIEDVVNQIKINTSVRSINFSGGEPLIYINQIEEIIAELKKFNKNIKYEITTNGSMVINLYERIQNLNFDLIKISIDKFHLEYCTIEKINQVIEHLSSTAKKIEVIFTYSNEEDFTLLSKIITNDKVTLSLGAIIDSGRYKATTIQKKQKNFKTINCPNLIENRLTFLKGTGFTPCCGPVLWNKVLPRNFIGENSIDIIQSNLFHKTLRRMMNSELLVDNNTSCNNCASVFQNTTLVENLKHYVNDNLWENIIELDKESELEQLNILFNPKLVFTYPKNSLKSNSNDFSNIEIKEIDSLTDSQILNFTNFTVENFYEKHNNFYSEKSINVFKEHQKVFYSLKNKTLIHYCNGTAIAYLTIAEIPLHSYFQEPVWHIGYWGISDHIKDKNMRDNIKSDWFLFLSTRNKENRVAGNIDFFNLPAIKMAESNGMQKVCIRLDPRP